MGDTKYLKVLFVCICLFSVYTEDSEFPVWFIGEKVLFLECKCYDKMIFRSLHTETIPCHEGPSNVKTHLALKYENPIVLYIENPIRSLLLNADYIEG